MRSTYTIRFAPPIASFVLSYTDRDGAEGWVITASNIEPLIERCRGEPVTILPAMRNPADARDPDPTREGIFRDHNCSRCKSGERACVRGNPRSCEWPHARND